MTTRHPDRLILVYDGDSGVRAMLLDVLEKASGREECALCEITYGPLGKRREWVACEKRLEVSVDELHRDGIPASWGLKPAEIPCVLARAGRDMPTTLVTRDEVATCRGSVQRLEELIVTALARSRRST